jgi:hypothetical protein
MATQIPMISVPLKQTNEIDWIQPLKGYIRQTYGDDPERYAEECATLNRLRQDMRGAGKDSAAGRDLLYRYYGSRSTRTISRSASHGTTNIWRRRGTLTDQVRRIHTQAHIPILPRIRES